MKGQPLRIAFLILAHNRPDALIRIIDRLLASGGAVVIHFDSKAEDKAFDQLRKQYSGRADVLFPNRVSVTWGGWSIVQATINGLKALQVSPIEVDYVYLLSGSDYPIKQLKQLRDFLTTHSNKDFIEAFDTEKQRWVTQGIQQERYEQYHFINWRDFPRLFSWSLGLQKTIKIHRKMPHELHPYMGSQWWCLRWGTLLKILEYTESPEIIAFFRRTWVPDELFFQTMVGNLVLPEEQVNATLTLAHFSSYYGIPLVFSNGHEDFLSNAPFFFARKISPFADELKGQLDYLEGPTPELSDLGCVPQYLNKKLSEYGSLISKHTLMGYVAPGPRGIMVQNSRKYIVVIAQSDLLAKNAMAALNSIPELLCHGLLFSSEKIYYANKITTVAGYSYKDTTLRDYGKSDFLYQIINEDSMQTMGFLHQPSNLNDEVVQLTLNDPNALFVICTSNRLNTSDNISSAVSLNVLLGIRRVRIPKGLPLVEVDDDDTDLISKLKKVLKK